MTTEIELKYLVSNENTAEIITELLTKHQIEFIESCHQLTNCYFDTPDLNLRHHDMGLRIREKNNVLEQTIKTAGKIVGGLHQRPEFNVPLTDKKPDLTLFPDEVWEPTQKINIIQEQLVSLFSTNFERRTWLINTKSGGVVEVVFDQGDVSSQGMHDPICEIELELVRGDVAELFLLAKLFFTQLNLRPSSKSKAARGYDLWNNISKIDETDLSKGLISLNVSDSIDSSFIKGFTYLLGVLQSTIDSYINEPLLSKLAIVQETLKLMEQGFSLYDVFITDKFKKISSELTYFIDDFDWVENAIYLKEITNKTGNYRKKLDYSESLIDQLKLEKRRFPNNEAISKIFMSEQFNLLQLSLLEMIMPHRDLFNEKINDIDLLTFATAQLSKSLNELTEAMPEAVSLTSVQYLELNTLSDVSLHVGRWLGALFDESERRKYRAPWLDLREGISELQVLWIIQQQLQTLPEQPKKLVSWQNSKVENLLHALDHSRKSALSIVPYWV